MNNHSKSSQIIGYKHTLRWQKHHLSDGIWHIPGYYCCIIDISYFKPIAR